MAQADVIADLGEIFLGSRLKRLAERLQGGASRFVGEMGHGAAHPYGLAGGGA